MTLGALLDQAAAELPGRDRERAALLELVRADRPLVTVVHGLAGMGKSALLEAFRADARREGAVVVALDARGVEPTARGFSAAVAALVAPDRPPAAAAVQAALGALGERVVLIVDGLDVLGMLDPWLAGTFVPALPANVRVLLAGRERPSASWTRAYGDALRELPLGGLRAPDARRFLRRAGVDPDVDRLAHGHPLTLRLAASTLGARPGASTDGGLGVGPLVDQLARLYLVDLDEPTWRALGAASVTRRMTLSLLAAMLPGEPPWDAFERLRALPFVDLGPDGLLVHDTVRAAAAALLRAADPVAFARHRTVAWRTLREELRQAGEGDLWRYTADLLYLVERPVVRQFFFPKTVLDCVVEPARPDDWPAISALARGEQIVDMSHLVDWWQAVPEAFAVVRDADGAVTGFRCLAERGQISPALARRDPAAERIRDHLRRDPLPRGALAVVVRYLATREDREEPSQAQAALFLDVTRAYLAARPALRRAYTMAPLVDAADGLCAQVLGYVPLPGEPAATPAGARIAFNDYGPGSLDGWLTDLAARELGLEPESPVDAVQRRLRLDGAPVDLTQLEFDVLRYLQQHEGRAITREALLRDVWGYDWTGGSNVVEVAISALRRKLGAHASALRTVRGVGYRLEGLA